MTELEGKHCWYALWLWLENKQVLKTDQGADCSGSYLKANTLKSNGQKYIIDYDNDEKTR